IGAVELQRSGRTVVQTRREGRAADGCAVAAQAGRVERVVLEKVLAGERRASRLCAAREHKGQSKCKYSRCHVKSRRSTRKIQWMSTSNNRWRDQPHAAGWSRAIRSAWLLRPRR